MTTLAANTSVTITLDGDDVLTTDGNATFQITPTSGGKGEGYLTGHQTLGPYGQYVTIVLTSINNPITYSQASDTDAAEIARYGKDASGNITSLVSGDGTQIAFGPPLMTLAEMLAYAPTTDGVEVYVTDLYSGTRGRFYWHLASSKWRPAGMVLVDRSLTLDSGVNSTAEQYLKNLRIPGGLLFTGAEILFEYSLARSNATDAGTTANMRIGNAGTISDSAFGGGSGFGALTSATRANGNSHRYRVASATEIEKGGTGSAQGSSFAASGSSTPVALWNVGSTTSTLYFAPTVQLAAATGTTLPQVGYCALWLLPS